MKTKIKSVYRLRGDQVIAFDKEGLLLRQYAGTFELIKNEVLKNLKRDTEFYIATLLMGNFEKVTKEQWVNYVRKE